MRINQNIAALNAHRNMGITDRQMGQTMEKLSSGLRINRAADDAAGLAISERMRSQVAGLDQAVSNAQDGISLIQTAEGALDESHAILNRVRELTVQAANEVNEGGDVEKIQDEVIQLVNEIDRIAETTEFNTKALIDGALDGIDLQIGANEGQSMHVGLRDMAAEALGLRDDDGINQVEFFDSAIFRDTGEEITLDTGDFVEQAVLSEENGETLYQTGQTIGTGDSGSYNLLERTYSVNYEVGDPVPTDTYYTAGGTVIEGEDGNWEATDIPSVKDNDGFGELIVKLDTAIDDVSAFRSELGAVQNRLEHTMNNLEVASENLSAAESRIRDADMAAEMMDLTRHQIMQQAGTGMMAQANMQPQTVLQLLG